MRASYRNSEQTVFAPVVVQRMPDLVPSISAPATAQAGEEIGSQVFVEVENRGIVLARGTDRGDYIDEGGGYMVEIVLSTDTSVPPGSAVAAPFVFREDALLVGGREIETPDIPAGSEAVVVDGATRLTFLNPLQLPDTIPPGIYFLCAVVDPENRVQEENEGNNVGCIQITIGAGGS